MLEEFLNKRVNICTIDGRLFVTFIKIGKLKTIDSSTNIVLTNCFERIFSLSEPPESIKLDSFIIRGDNISLIMEVDEEEEKGINIEEIRAPPINPIQH